MMFDTHITILHEFAAALGGVSLTHGARLGLRCLGRAGAARLALAKALERLAEGGFIDFVALGALVFFLRKGKKIVIR